MRRPIGDTAGDGYVHEALFYGSQEELLATVVPFLRAGLNAGEHAVVVCTQRNAALLTEALDADIRIGFLASHEVYRCPAGAISAYQQIMERGQTAGARRVRLVGEVDFGTGPEDWAHWSRFEAIVNRALGSYPLWSICMYDTRQAPSDMLAAAELTHPTLITATKRVPNDHYLDPAEFLRQCPSAGPDPLERTPPALHVEDATNLARLRHNLRHAALTGSALPAQTVDDFIVAVNEVATNAARHGSPPVRVQLWTTPARLLCTVTDRGAGFVDPFAGYLAPNGDNLARGGRGLWLARQLCDHLDTFTTPGGFAVRLATSA